MRNIKSDRKRGKRKLIQIVKADPVQEKGRTNLTMTSQQENFMLTLFTGISIYRKHVVSMMIDEADSNDAKKYLIHFKERGETDPGFRAGCKLTIIGL